MKKYLLTIGIFCFSIGFAQVGINTTTPATTLDVVGKPTDTSSFDGLTAPRITGNQLRAKAYTGAQTGALVYITVADTAPSGQTINITNTGYYYFDGSVWQSTGTASVAGDTTNDAFVNNTSSARVELGAKSDGTARSTGTQFAISDAGKVGIGAAPDPIAELLIATGPGQALKILPQDATDPTGSTRMQIRNDQSQAINFGMTNSGGIYAGGTVPSNTAFLLTSGTATNMVLGTDNTPKITIFNDGKMGIGSIFPTQAATASLDIDGNVRVRSTPYVVDVIGKNILLTEINGDIKQITSSDFISSLRIPELQVIALANQVVVPGSTRQVVDFNSTEINSQNIANITTDVLTMPTNGIYEFKISGSITMGGVSGGVGNANIYVEISKDGGTTWIRKSTATTGNGPQTFTYAVSSVVLLSLNAGDLVRVVYATCNGCVNNPSYTYSDIILSTVRNLKL